MTLLRRGAGSPRSHRRVRVFGAIVPRLPGSPAPRLAKAPLVLLSIVYVLARRVLSFVLLRFRSEHSKDLELVALRHELSVLRRQVTRPQLDDGDRVFLTLTGRVLRYVAVEDDEAAPLVSFGSPADPKACMGRTCTVTDRVSIGMNAASRLGRPNDPADQVGIVARSHHLHLHIAGPQGTRRRVVPKV